MNILDLAYKFEIEVNQDPDFDRCNYDMTFKYITATQRDITDVRETVTIEQADIEHLYEGVKKLLAILKPYTMDGY